MVAYTKPQQRKKEERKKLRGERGQIKFIDLRSERRQVVGLDVEERLWWPIQCPNKGRRKKAKS